MFLNGPIFIIYLQGAYYMLLEQVSQLYRCIVPIMPWFYFLCEEAGGVTSPRWFSYILIILYFVLKVIVLLRNTEVFSLDDKLINLVWTFFLIIYILIVIVAQ